MKFLWIFDIDAVWTLGPACSALWSLGGSGIKALRRLGIPALIATSALSLGAPPWICAWGGGMILLVLTLPYGDDLKRKLQKLYYLALYGIGAIYGASLLPIAILSHRLLMWGVGICIMSAWFGASTYASQKFDFPKWKFCEILTGFIFGLLAARLLIP